MKRSYVIGLLVIGVAACSCRSPEKSATEQVFAAQIGLADCTETPCSIQGLNGECVRGHCILSGGHCTRNVDCDDGNECSLDRCEGGRCTGGNRTGACALDAGEARRCEAGVCESVKMPACLVDAECPTTVNPCAATVCWSGTCLRGARPDGTDCLTPPGRGGACDDGLCVPAEEDAGRCRSRYIPGVGNVPDCRARLRFSFASDEVERQEKVIEARLSDQLRYDMKASLVPLVAGGFNIVLHNRRSRREVRGLCDPSFVAFNMASYTAGTDWKSENLHIWLTPHEEGWEVPTRGSRAAVEYGQANSALGMYGVVEVRAFRSWLEKSFSPLEASAEPVAGELETTFHLDALPTPPDAGLVTLVGVVPAFDAGPALPRAAGQPTGLQELDSAWRLYGEGATGKAREALRRAEKAGVHSPDLRVLLEGTP